MEIVDCGFDIGDWRLRIASAEIETAEPLEDPPFLNPQSDNHQSAIDNLNRQSQSAIASLDRQSAIEKSAIRNRQSAIRRLLPPASG
jgi:hypothetical protein